jgi:hypothetical protein
MSIGDRAAQKKTIILERGARRNMVSPSDDSIRQGMRANQNISVGTTGAARA